MNTDACPSFRDPPVVETALSIQFDELRNFRTTHFGMYHATVKDRFPVVEDKPRIEPVIESFPRVPRVPALRIAPAGGGPDRVWFIEPADGSMLLQLQPDRFVFNWCKKEGQEYPRYESYRPRLLKEFEQFSNFAAGQELGEVKPNLCEVTYVNRIDPIENETPTDCFAMVFTGIDWKSSDGWLPQPPDVVTLNRVFTIGEEKGRLYAEASIATDKAAGGFILLKITARVIHKDGDDLQENMDLAHLWVVKSFVSLTEEHVRHERWGQKS
jgi:uncharacterized protein (TIGR04255 family)